MLSLRALLLIGLVPALSAYVFDCLDGCECDTDDEVVHCHNGDRTEFPLPTGQRLRGFPVIGLTYNKLTTLPEESVLLERFPDLKVIDVERNKDMDCSQIASFEKVKIISDCDKNISEIHRVPRIFRPTKDCDITCQAERHYRQLHLYVKDLWEVLKSKYEDFDSEETLQQIRDFFIKLIQKINKVVGTVKDAIQDGIQQSIDGYEHPKNIKAQVTPLPELASVDEH